MSPDAFIGEASDSNVTHLLKASFSSQMGGRMAEVCAASVATCLDLMVPNDMSSLKKRETERYSCLK